MSKNQMTYKPTPMTAVAVPTRVYRNGPTNRFMSATQITEKFKNLQHKTNIMTRPNQPQAKNDMQKFD